jgi:hypothetical protein
MASKATFALGNGRRRTTRWFRANCRRITWPACFALAFQFCLAFGYARFGRIGDNPILLALSGSEGDTSAGSLPQKNPAHHWGDFCAICVNTSLAGTLVLPILAIILAPRLFTEILSWSLAASEPASFDHLPFSARGPPHA